MMNVRFGVIDGAGVQMRLKRRRFPLIRIVCVYRAFDLLGGHFAASRLQYALHGLGHRDHL